MNTVKKYRRSKVATVCYVLAALMMVYTCYQIGNTIYTINQYYGQYDMKATPNEYFTYIMQNGLEPLIHTVVFFMLGFILDEVRKLNPANWLSDEDIADKKMEKQASKDAKQFEKKEAKTGNKPAVKDEPVVADFTADVKEDVKEEAPKKAPAKKTASKSAASKSTAAKKTGAKTTAKKSTSTAKKKTTAKKEETKESKDE